MGIHEGAQGGARSLDGTDTRSQMRGKLAGVRGHARTQSQPSIIHLHASTPPTCPTPSNMRTHMRTHLLEQRDIPHQPIRTLAILAYEGCHLAVEPKDRRRAQRPKG